MANLPVMPTPPAPAPSKAPSSSASSAPSGDGKAFAGLVENNMSSQGADKAPSTQKVADAQPHDAPAQASDTSSAAPADASSSSQPAEPVTQASDSEPSTPAETLTSLLETQTDVPVQVTAAIQAQVQASQAEAQALAAQLAQIQAALQANGVDIATLAQSTDNLKNALMTLGISESDATDAATQLKAALEKAKVAMGLTADQQNALAFLAVASASTSLTPLQPVVVKTPTPEAATTVAQTTLQQKFPTTGTSLARAVAGVAQQAAPVVAPSTPSVRVEDGTLTLTSDEKSSTDGTDTTPSSPTTLVLTPVQLPSNPDTNAQTASNAQISATTAAAANQAASLPQAISQSLAAGAAQTPIQVSKVETSQVVNKPAGEVMYKWKSAETGVETLQATPAVGKQEGLDNAALFSSQGMLVNPSATSLQGAAQSAATPRFESVLSQAHHLTATEQTAVQVQNLAEQGGGIIRMRLTPAELGEIHIELKIADGQVQGSISATQSQVVHELARDLHQLRQSLADAGLKLGQEGISLMLNNSGQNGSQNNGQQTGSQSGETSSGSNGWDDGLEAVSTLESEPAMWVSPERVLDVRI